MRWLLSLLLLAIAAVASAKSFTGNRLLVVLEEQAEREKAQREKAGDEPEQKAS